MHCVKLKFLVGRLAAVLVLCAAACGVADAVHPELNKGTISSHEPPKRPIQDAQVEVAAPDSRMEEDKEESSSPSDVFVQPEANPPPEDDSPVEDEPVLPDPPDSAPDEGIDAGISDSGDTQETSVDAALE
jgi:hypothetical protein